MREVNIKQIKTQTCDHILGIKRIGVELFYLVCIFMVEEAGTSANMTRKLVPRRYFIYKKRKEYVGEKKQLCSGSPT